MRFGIVVFPGTWSDTDCHHAVNGVLGQEAEYVWHQQTSLENYDCIILPGGFSYGDYLRPGAMAGLSPIMETVKGFANSGGLVFGICNGFQILCESGLLPGALLRNEHLEYRCQWTNLRTERADTPFTRACQPGQVLRIPVSHGEGNYYANATTLDQLESEGRVLFRYCGPTGEATRNANPNGAARNIAGIINSEGNVLGMMPHPERCCEEVLGSADGKFLFQSIVESCR
jgi:phosphoribosylformylglycinamidine synthase